MIIPKQFDGLEDLEAMLLTSVLGTLVALKDDLISLKQAESYWLSDFTADLFEALNLSEQLRQLLAESLTLKDLQDFSSLYKDKLDDLIAECKSLMANYYTEYTNESILPTAVN